MKLLGVLRDWFYGMDYIAEDLGLLTPEVGALLDASGFPGMNVLQFAFSPDASSKYLPHRQKQNSVCYAGTHDNNTILGWWKDPAVPDAEKAFAKMYLGLTAEEGIAFGVIRGGMASPADLFIAQMQDWLGLDETARMNVPGTALGNWTWRMIPDRLTMDLATEILVRTNMYGRNTL